MKYFTLIFLSVWALAGALTAQAQTITPIYSFTNGPADPDADLVLGPGGSFYGATTSGGMYNYGCIFQVTTNGILTVLASFNSTNGGNSSVNLTVGPDGNLYGTTGAGDFVNDGTIFRLATNGIFTTLFNFNGTNGSDPNGLTLGPDGNFYGTTGGGGGGADTFGLTGGILGGVGGTVFRVTTNGILTTLFNFEGTNGANPVGNLTLGPDGNFYGVTEYGGPTDVGLGAELGYGTVFQVTTNGTLTTLVNFSTSTGEWPSTGLTLGPDGDLYGSTVGGEFPGIGISPGGEGALFKITTEGELIPLFNFVTLTCGWPKAALILGPDGNLYGNTSVIGGYNLGSIFRIATNGAITGLMDFNSNNNGFVPNGFVLGSDGNFYGTTSQDGSDDAGEIYRLDLPPEIVNSPTNQNIVIGDGADLEATTYGTGPFSFQWLSNGVPIDEATNCQLSIGELTTNEQYQIIITNAYGSVTSSVACLTPVAATPALSSGPNGSMILNLATSTNFGSRLYFTTNLTPPIVWEPIYTNVGGGTWQFTDTNGAAGNSGRFYRLSTP